MTTPLPTSNNNNQMHNDIMAAGSKDRPPMLAIGRYAQWQLRFMRYIDTRPNCKELKKCIYDGPYVMTKILVSEKPATSTEEAVPAHTITETYKNTTPGKRTYFDAEAEAIHLILTRIRDDIYSTIDACTTTKEIHKGKEIAKPITPPSKSTSDEDSDPEQSQRDKQLQKKLALIAKKPKRAKDYAYHKEKMLLCKQAEKGMPLSAEQGDWLDDTDEELDEQ
ncbi:hypothetical protein Tco_0351693 [Tanacetum coccineum]